LGEHLPLGGRAYAGKGVQQQRLAHAVRAQHRQELTRREREIEPAHQFAAFDADIQPAAFKEHVRSSGFRAR
jgi:hypothetical protein